MEASIESSNAKVCCSEKEFITAKKRAEGIDLRISSTTLAYPLQKKHHPLLQGNLEVLFLNPILDH